MPESRQRFVVEFSEEYSAMVNQLKQTLGVSQIEVFRRAIDALYRDVVDDAKK